MRRIKIMGIAVMAALVTAAMLASVASAKSALILKDPSGVIAAGTPITLVSHNLTTVTSAGSLECENVELEPVLENNSASKDKGSATGSQIRAYGEYLGIPGACATSSAGPVEITTSGYPWHVEFSTKGTIKIKGTKKLAFTSEFLGLAPPNKCTFEASKIASTFTPGPAGSPQAVDVTTSGAKFKLNKKAPGTAPICPTEGTMGGTWITEDANGEVSSEL